MWQNRCVEFPDPRAQEALLERSRSVRAESGRIAARYAEIREHIGLERRRSLTRTTESIDREVVAHPVMLARLDRLAVQVGRSPEIERAKSLLAERHGISRGEAFALLRTVSSRSNHKLRDVAADILAEESGGGSATLTPSG
jgi:hypothetical protein